MTQPNQPRDRPHVVAVTGGRAYGDWKHVGEVLSRMHAERKIDLIVHGGAGGADSLAMLWAVMHYVQFAEFKVTTKQWRVTGKSAGPRRNHLMLAVCRPDVLVVFPGESGTTNCARQAKRIGIEIVDESKGTVVV